MVLPPNIEDVPPPGLALVEELDKLLLVQVRLRLPPPPPAAFRHCCLPPTLAAPAAAALGAVGQLPSNPYLRILLHQPAVARRAQDCGHSVLV